MKLHVLLLVSIIALSGACGEAPEATDQVAPVASTQPAAPADVAAADEDAPLTESVQTGETVETEGDLAETEQAVEESIILTQADTPTAPSRFRKGTHYIELAPTQPTSSPPDKIEVAEIFWYGCGHCYNFEPYLDRWVQTKPADVAFVRIPAMWNNLLRVHARAFYTAEVLDVLDRIHGPMFRTIHVDKNPLDDEDKLAQFFVEQGVDETEFRDTFNSFAVETRMQRADVMNRRYRISNVPTVVVNGKYKTGSGMSQGYDNLVVLMSELVASEANNR